MDRDDHGIPRPLNRRPALTAPQFRVNFPETGPGEEPIPDLPGTTSELVPESPQVQFTTPRKPDAGDYNPGKTREVPEERRCPQQ